jgi:hypothetical protein
MPPRYLRRASSTRLKPCQERTFEACNTTAHDGCCGVTPCRICITWDAYGDPQIGSSDFGTSSWTGDVAGIDFQAYWQRNHESGECEFIVIFNSVEVYRATCYEGANCRNPEGSASATVNYDGGTLSWRVYEPRELQLIDDPDTGCRTHFCDNCRCSCECLCVTLTEYGGSVTQGELCDVNYDCDAPLWVGSIGDYALEIALDRDQYGNCIITLTADGNARPPVSAPGCSQMSSSVTMPNGDVFDIRCKQCGCDDGVYACCGGIPLPRVLYADVISPPNGPAPVYECYNAPNVPLTYRAPSAPTFSHEWVGTTVITDGCGRSHNATITLTCVAGSEEDDGSGNVRGDFTATIDHELLDTIPDRCITNFPTLKATSCSPFMLGNDTWGDMDQNGILDCIFGVNECIECPTGLSLRITE